MSWASGSLLTAGPCSGGVAAGVGPCDSGETPGCGVTGAEAGGAWLSEDGLGVNVRGGLGSTEMRVVLIGIWEGLLASEIQATTGVNVSFTKAV